MTSINAMRFDEYSGMLICDEARSWNDENGRFLTAEKMRLVISDEVIKATGSVIYMGKTGTSTLGNEFLESTKDALTVKFNEMVEKQGKPLDKFMTVKEVAHFLFHNLCEVKRKHIDYTLKSRYGFTSNDFVAGFYKNAKGERVDIKDKTVIDEVHKIMTWEGMNATSKSIFLNAQVVAGYEPTQGFRIFRSSLIAPHCEPVHEIFSCDGSGVDSTDFVFTAFANTRTISERRGNIDRVEGLAVLLEALNLANESSAGCDGYLKIQYINGREKDHLSRNKEIHDCRSKLAQEIVKAAVHDFILWKKAYELLEAVIYEDVAFLEVDDAFKRASTKPQAMLDMLRGHRCWRNVNRL